MILSRLREIILKNDTLLEWLYLLLFAFYYSFIFLETTMFHGKFLIPIYLKGTIIVTLLIGVKFITISKNDWKEWGAAIMLLICFSLSWLSYQDITILILGVYVVAAKGVSFRKIIWLTFTIGSGIMVTAFVASQLGYIEDLVYYLRGAYHHSFGITYSTDFAAHFLFLFLQYCYLKRGNLRILEYVVVILLSIPVFWFSRARTNMICFWITCIAMFLNNERRLYIFGEKIKRNIKKVMILSVPVCAIVILALTWNYRSDNVTLENLNQLLSGRLSMGKLGITQYGISLFGRLIQIRALGETTVLPDNYFMIDSSYVLILLTRGLIVLCIVCSMHFIYSCRAYARNEGYLLIIISVIAIQCLMEHHMLDISYNVFLLLAFAKQEQVYIIKNGKVKPYP